MQHLGFGKVFLIPVLPPLQAVAPVLFLILRLLNHKARLAPVVPCVRLVSHKMIYIQSFIVD